MNISKNLLVKVSILITNPKLKIVALNPEKTPKKEKNKSPIF